MKTSKTLLNLLLVTLVTFMLSACNTKTNQDENSTTEGTTTSTNGGAGTSSGGSSSGTGNTAGSGNDNSTGGGSDDNTTTSTNDDNTTTTPTATLSSLTLTMGKTSLKKDENTTVKVEATYSDNTSKEVTDKVEWIVTPSDSVKVTNATLTALKDKATSIQAKVGNTLSNPLNITIAWTVNGHTLPPEPDTTINNSTLLGVDVNDNGVRDDVERWIYEEYKDKHPIHVDIGMQAARGYKLVLESSERAREIHDEVVSAGDCESYSKIYAKYFNKPLLVKVDITTKHFRHTIYFNTKERMDVYIQYDTLLSGYTYSTPAVDENMSSYCNFDINKYEE